MEVPGQKGATVKVFSNPCRSKGSRIPARGYCKDCREYLCNTCYNVHTIPRPLQHHILLDAANMPPPSSGYSDDCDTVTITTKCPDHPSQVVDIICFTHKMAICSKCAFRQHKTCDAKDIHVEAKGFDMNDVYSGLMASIGQLDLDIGYCSNTAYDIAQDGRQSCDTVSHDIKSLKENVVAFWDMKEKECASKVKQKQQRIKEHEQSKQSKLTGLSDRVKRVKTNLTTITTGDLLIATKLAEAEIYEIQRDLMQVSSKNLKTLYSFRAETKFEAITSLQTPIGELIESKSIPQSTYPDFTHTATITYMQENKITRTGHDTSMPVICLSTATVNKITDINVKLSTDQSDCCVSGMDLLSPSTLLIVDKENSRVKIVDTVTNTITSSLEMPSGPYDVAVLQQCRAAVTLPDAQQLHILATRPHLQLVRDIKVKGRCYGIESTSDRLIVSYIGPGKVEIIHYYGQLLQTISRVDDTFYPFNLAVTCEGDRSVIYVSDRFNSHSVRKWSMAGQLIYTYKDSDLSGPRGLAVTGNNFLLVASWAKHSIHLVSQEGKNVRIMLQKIDGIEYPQALCCCDVENNLYVSCHALDESAALKNNIKVYQFR